MKTTNILALTLVLVFFNFNAFGQKSTSIKCNVSIVNEMENNIGTASENLMTKFLETFGKECNNNVEFGEYSNETLFKVIQNQPNLFFKILEKNRDKIELDQIIDEIENPISDMINLKLVQQKITEIKTNDSTKKRLLKAIEVAIAKLN